MIYRYVDSPIGQLLLGGEGRQLHVVGFPEGSQAFRAQADWEQDETSFADVKGQLDEYFKGERREFELDLAPAGTPFQLSVLTELLKIPYGETCSYRDIATAIGIVVSPLTIKLVIPELTDIAVATG